MADTINFSVHYENGSNGQNAFEMWKVANNLPNATYQEFEAFNRGKNSFELWKIEHNLPTATWADYEAFNKGTAGFATPMTQTQREAIIAPTLGQVINQTDGGRGEWVWVGYWLYKENRPYTLKTITASRDLTTADLGYILMVDSTASGVTLNIPPGVFNLGHKLFLIQKGFAKITITKHATITVQPPPYYSLTSAGVGALLEIIFVSPSLAYLQGHTQ